MGDPTETAAWQALAAHKKTLESVHLRDLFAQDPRRFERFSLRLDDLLFDFSKHHITSETLRLLVQLARETEVPRHIEAMFAGERINVTEQRAVLHVALRNRSNRPILLDGRDVMPDVNRVLGEMRIFTDAIRSGSWRGYTGAQIRDVVNLGIGGSDLGPAMVAQALRPHWQAGLRAHFVSNVDPTHLSQTLADLDPASTLFIVASKSFTTQETLANARTAREWIVSSLGDEEAVANHFVALSTNAAAVAEFGIPPENRFVFWDWVGGRYSLWSAVGLAVACVVGMDRFEELLEGAHDVDEHFRTAPLAENIPVIMALLGVWYQGFWDAHAHAVLPYDQLLARLPAHLQQVDMESNGKGVDRQGRPITGYHTGPILFGEPGTCGQHAFYQLLHQSRRLVPCDFLVAAQGAAAPPEQHDLLVANCLAQSEAFLRGKTEAEARAELEAAGLPPDRVAVLLPHKVFPGNRPSSTFLYRKLTPRTLGRLVALYEHKVFVQGVLWNIFSFDQWGVELGKQLAKTLVPEVQGTPHPEDHDASTAGLLAHLHALRNDGDTTC